MTPTTIEHDNRKAVITGSRVQLFRLRPRNKKKPLEKPIWPEMEKITRAEAWNTAVLWTIKGLPDLEERH